MTNMEYINIIYFSISKSKETLIDYSFIFPLKCSVLMNQIKIRRNKSFILNLSNFGHKYLKYLSWKNNFHCVIFSYICLNHEWVT